MTSTAAERLNELISRADSILAGKRTVQTSSFSSSVYVDNGAFHEWMAASLSFLRLTFGAPHTHTKLFEDRCTKPLASHVVQGQGILKAAIEDIERGYLVTLEALVSADVFTDFLSMATHLIEHGYKDPAASLIGAVLEDALRRIAISHGLSIRERDDISSLNSRLAEAKVYNRLTQQRVQVWSSIRNNADHGKFSEYTTTLVSEMSSGVATFISDHLTSRSIGLA